MRLRSLCFHAVALWLMIHAPIALADNEAKPQLQIRIPNQLGSLVVGKSNYNDLVKLLGKAEFVEHVRLENTQEELLEVKYPRMGIEFTIIKNKQMRISRIEVYRPFNGKTVEGVFVGMPIPKARDILIGEYGNPASEMNGYVDWKTSNTFALKHENGAVVAIKMVGL